MFLLLHSHCVIVSLINIQAYFDPGKRKPNTSPVIFAENLPFYNTFSTSLLADHNKSWLADLLDIAW